MEDSKRSENHALTSYAPILGKEAISTVRDIKCPMRTRIKICCIASVEEARVAIRYGADAIGLVAAVGPRMVDDRTNDWEVSAEFVRRSPLPVFLAGGLSPSNVGEAIRRIRPFAVDLCSGVRTDGQLDREKLTAFIDAVRWADAGNNRIVARWR